MLYVKARKVFITFIDVGVITQSKITAVHMDTPNVVSKAICPEYIGNESAASLLIKAAVCMRCCLSKSTSESSYSGFLLLRKNHQGFHLACRTRIL